MYSAWYFRKAHIEIQIPNAKIKDIKTHNDTITCIYTAIAIQIFNISRLFTPYQAEDVNRDAQGEY